MPFTHTTGARIYYRVEGEGLPIVMLHGFGDSLDDWYEAGYVEALRDEFKLVMLDCLGHGLSDRPHAPEAYSMSSRVRDVVAVLDALGIEQAHFWGYSMGARIGFSVIESVPGRILSAVLAGIDQHGPDPARFRNRIRFLSRGMESFLEGFEARFGTMEPPTKRARYLRADHLAMIAASMGLRDHVRDFSDLAPRMAMPCLIYDGDRDAFHDNAREFTKLLPNARFISLPGLDHGGTFTRTDLVLPVVREFLAGSPR